MEIENRIVCFMDILGFRDIINRFEKTKDISIVTKIQTAFNSSLKTITDFTSLENTKKLNISPENIETITKDLYYKSFSDNIIITLKYEQINDSFLRKLSLLVLFSNIFQFEMHQKGVYIRGGISYGSYISDDNIIFSTALVKAYELESKKSLYPRITLDPELINIIANGTKENLKESGLNKLIYFDDFGVAFLSPFSPLDVITSDLEEIIKNELINPDSSFNKLIELLPDNFKSVAKNPFQFLLTIYKSQLADIQSKSKDLELSESARDKYLWLTKFYNWKYKKATSTIKFKTFNQQLETESDSPSA